MNRSLSTSALALALALSLALGLAGVPAGRTESFTLAAEFGGKTGPARIIGNTAYVVRGHYLDVLDLRDRAHPRKIRQLDLVSSILDIDTTGSTLLVLAGDRIGLFGIANPAAPAFIRDYPLPYPELYSSFIAITSTTVALRAYNSVTLLDLSHPATSRDLQFGSIGQVTCLDSDGKYLYVTRQAIADSFVIYKLDGLSTPTLMGALDNHILLQVRVSGDRAYAVDGYDFFPIDISNRAAPAFLPHLDINARALEIDAGRALVELRDGGFALVDISDPGQASILATLPPPKSESRLAALDWPLGLLIDLDGYQLLDLSPPGALTPKGRYNAAVNLFWNMAIRGPLVCAAQSHSYTGNTFLATLDITSVTTPTVRGRSLLGSEIYWGMTLAGDLALTIGRTPDNQKLLIYGIADLTSPTLKSRIPMQDVFFLYGPLNCLFALSGHRLYLRDSSSTLNIYDLAQPAAPVLERAVPLPEGLRGIIVIGARALVLSQDRLALQLYDLTDPLVPALLGTYRSSLSLELIPGSSPPFVGVIEQGNFTVISFAQPQAPVRLGSLAGATPYVMGIAVSPTMFFMKNWYNLEAIDAAQPAAPVVRAKKIQDAFEYFAAFGSRVILDQNLTNEIILDYSRIIGGNAADRLWLNLP